jgi:hypothetical protein
MNKKLVLAASIMVLACACESKQPMQQNVREEKKEDQSCSPSGDGCCGMKTPQAAPESEKAAAAPAQQAQATTAVPAVQAESKAP